MQGKNKISSSEIYKRIVIGAFLTVPFFSSLISTVHAVNLFGLGNKVWMAICLAIVFELGQLGSLMTLAVLDKINKGIVWSIFVVLAFMQIVGNVYYTFDFISQKLKLNGEWLDTALELINKFAYKPVDPITGKFILSLVIGVPIPLISIAFLKSLTDYLKPKDSIEVLTEEITKENKEDQEDSVIEDSVIEDSVIEDSVIEDSVIESKIEEVTEPVDTNSIDIDKIWEDEKAKEKDLGIVDAKESKSSSHTPYINNNQ
jgi:hypothetical protein